MTTSLMLAAVGLSRWPESTAPRRLRLYTGRPDLRAGKLGRHGSGYALPAVAGLAVLGGYVLLGFAGASSCLLLGIAVRRRYLEHVCVRTSFESGRRLAEGMRALVLELRAGTHPAAAAETAAADTDATTGTALRAVAATQRLGGDPEAVAAHRHGAGPDAVVRLGHAWTLARRHGLPLADVLAEVQRDVAGRVRFATDVHAGMAGVRASATVLAALPVAGLAFGTLLGAQPLRVLVDTVPGQSLLLVGSGLLAAGLLWSGRLARDGVRV